MAKSFISIFVDECSKGRNFEDVFIRALKVWAVQIIEDNKESLVSRVVNISKHDTIDIVLKLELNGGAIKGLMEIYDGRDVI